MGKKANFLSRSHYIHTIFKSGKNHWFEFNCFKCKLNMDGAFVVVSRRFVIRIFSRGERTDVDDEAVQIGQSAQFSFSLILPVPWQAFNTKWYWSDFLCHVCQDESQRIRLVTQQHREMWKVALNPVSFGMIMMQVIINQTNLSYQILFNSKSESCHSTWNELTVPIFFPFVCSKRWNN